MSTKLEPRVVAPDEVQAIHPFGLNMKVLLKTEETDGVFSALLIEHEPGAIVPPHFHRKQEEYFCVIEGTYELQIGETTRTVGPGSVAFIPRNTLHTFKNVGQSVAKMLDWSIPGGQDRYFTKVDQLASGGGFTGDTVNQIHAEFDTLFPS